MARQPIGELIAERRRALRMSQAELGRLIGLDDSSVSRVERGLQRVDADDLDRWAIALRTTVIELYGGALRASG